jgi:uncharacterized protein YidB (DUF937 family)
MMKRKWLVAVAAGIAVAVVGVGAVLAQTPSGNGDGTSFLDRVAAKLGIDSPKLKQAITDVRNEDIDKAVANGDLTQKQADALKQRNADNPGFGEGHSRGFRGMGPKGPFGFGFGFGLPEAEQKLADFLGISADQLRTELQADNATLATVAQAHGKSRDALKTFITDGAKSKLDELVKSGDLTQKRADDMLSKLSDNLDKLIDANIGAGLHHFEFKFRGGPGGMMPNPNSVPAPQRGTFEGDGQQF